MIQAPDPSYFLLAYFLSETLQDGEQIRFAVSEGSEPIAWTPLNSGRPVLRSSVGEGGVRDPFLIRDTARGRFVVIATDLRVWPDEDWQRAVRHGSRSIVVWESTDLVRWETPQLREIAPATVGNTWAPKAFWSVARNRWLVFWASAIFDEADDRVSSGYQRILVAETPDFSTFTSSRVHLDVGHDVIDLTFLPHAGRWYRFSANAQSAEPRPDIGHHIFEEVGDSLENPAFHPLAVDIGKLDMARAEGPATAAHPSGDRWYLLADEFGLRGYQLFDTDDLPSGIWRHRTDARLPTGARHGSLLPITAGERDRLLAAQWPRV
jgi:hypothetical protein